MRVSKKSGKLRGQAIAGTHVVLIGLNMDKADTKDLLGFGIHRSDVTENEAFWLEGQKRFKATDPGFPPGKQVSTRDHPVQSFLWADYTAKPHHRYVYKVVALRGTPQALQERETLEFEIDTESETGDVHDVFFNRGAISSQAYATRFGNRDPDEVGEEALAWLSRGLYEALLAFIGQASSKDYALRAAVYEFHYGPALDAMLEARSAGADVRIIYDAKDNAKKDPKKKNEAAIAAARIKGICEPRTANASYIAHNKFIVLLKKGKPVAVWTGSTNISVNGIFGHLNVGHIVRDPKVAQAYLDYWNELAEDPEAKTLKPWATENTPAPTEVRAKDVAATVFSPRSNLDALDWYVDLFSNTKTAVFLTGAFGIPAPFKDVLSKPARTVRFLVLDKPGQTADAKAVVKKLKRVQGNQIVVATLLDMNKFDEWLIERHNPFSSNVEYLHTKFMLVDPLGDDPWVVAGSANFSEASTDKNDENMLVVRGNERLCDIYLGEFMRTYSHYAFREWAANTPKAKRNDISWLSPTDDWVGVYFQKGARKSLQREYFCP